MSENQHQELRLLNVMLLEGFDTKGLRSGKFNILKRGNYNQIPKWPINVVSIREATGSATNASVAGNAMRSISDPSASILNKSLYVIFH